jgi:transcriptional regulator with XRE-family HTH domain
VDSKLIRDTRKRLHCSRAVFARRLRINERTLEKWEQGRAKPNPQAAAVVLLVRNFPDTLDRLERVALGFSNTNRADLYPAKVAVRETPATVSIVQPKMRRFFRPFVEP